MWARDSAAHTFHPHLGEWSCRSRSTPIPAPSSHRNMSPEVDCHLGISLGMSRDKVKKAIDENPDAVAVLVNNPTYYGICSDLRAIVKMAHDAVEEEKK